MRIAGDIRRDRTGAGPRPQAALHVALQKRGLTPPRPAPMVRRDAKPVGDLEEGVRGLGERDRRLPREGDGQPGGARPGRPPAHRVHAQQGGRRPRSRLLVGDPRAADQARPGAHAPQAQPAGEPALRPRGTDRGARRSAMNVEALVTGPILPAPAAVFARLPAWRDRPRFIVPRGEEESAVTWGEYGDAIRACAAFLAETCLAPGERAALLAQNSVEWRWL